jgi:glutamate synthase (NADPH/NADH) large chain
VTIEHEYTYKAKGLPVAQGLYHPEHEKDACGVGFICNMDGTKSHAIIHDAIQILQRLTHRGACSSDNRTGDGAGLCIQVPDEFCQTAAQKLKLSLPKAGDYATGLFFLPVNLEERVWCQQELERICREQDQHFIGWRELPVNRSALGEIAARSEPSMWQLFIGRNSTHTPAGRDFERALFLIRKRVEKAIHHSTLIEKGTCYIPSLSSRTIIYKGLLQPQDFTAYFQDLLDPSMKTCLALVHQRYSTNTFPAWKLAQPFRMVCHNGEINTLRGNANWMNARQSLFAHPAFDKHMAELFPICVPGGSDSAQFDNCLELLYHTGRDLPHAMMMMVPEAWQKHQTMDEDRKAFYEYHSCLMEPWDGPALLPFTDGTFVGALLDRNGLRPARWLQTTDNQVVLASETGMLDIAPEKILRKGRLQPGRMFLINIEQGRIVEDEEIKQEIVHRKPYREWLDTQMVELAKLPPADQSRLHQLPDVFKQQQLFGYSLEDLRILLKPMALNGEEALGSMGVDTPLAVLSEKPQLLYNYFKQLFAQVTNPPLDAIREELVTSTITNLGRQRNIFNETEAHCRLLKLKSPVLSNEQLQQIRDSGIEELRTETIPMFTNIQKLGEGLAEALQTLCLNAEQALDNGAGLLILSDRGASKTQTPIPALLAIGAVHHHLIRQGKRSKCGLIVETAEAREVHHMACLLGYGAGAVNPYLAIASIEQLLLDGQLNDGEQTNTVTREKAIANYIKAVEKGVLKVMSKIGIATLQSYRGGQIFEIIGINASVIDKYFTGTRSRIAGAGLDEIAQELAQRHVHAYPKEESEQPDSLEVGGVYQWRRNGEQHLLNPDVIATLQRSTKGNNREAFSEFSRLVNEQNYRLQTLRGMLEFKSKRAPIALEDVEPWTEIVKRFKSGAMSYGSISREAHETLAIAMNRLGAKSNSGEGGEELHRFQADANGDSRSSAIKQIASGRFGVTSHYLANAKELQVKMAQGAKPGEGGQLPGAKVFPAIAKARHATAYVALVSPPPHHDIYSIEDMSQLIFDLKNANPKARINIKLVSEVGVGTVAAGVAKGKADVVLISGWDGGTGAAPETSLKHAGIPWELGLAEAQQTLVMNNLRGRIVVEVDGKLLTGRDVAVAALLGAEEFGFATAPLLAMGCIMMRVCHLNTCPVGIATQDPELRKKFNGSPESVINYFHMVAEDLREIMASLGFYTLQEMVGQVQVLKARDSTDMHSKARKLDLAAILSKPNVPDSFAVCNIQTQDHGLTDTFDEQLIKDAKPALENGTPVKLSYTIANTQRSIGTRLSYEISTRYHQHGLPDGTIDVQCKGYAGQSFAAFAARGLSFHIEGDANDYFGKGLSGALLSLKPDSRSIFIAENNIIVGNVALYGATSGSAYIRGIAGERFAVRNSGANAVVEGLGDHGCEYMTGGRVAVLGKTGRNFAAGMSGGIAYVLDEAGDFAAHRCNMELVELSDLNVQDAAELRELIENHYAYTQSSVAQKILADWENYLPRFIKVLPTDYKLALIRIAKEEAALRKTTSHSLELILQD